MTNRERLENLEGRTEKLETALIHAGVQPSGSKTWQIVGAALGIIVTIIISAVAATHVIDNDIGSKVSSVGTRVTKVEDAVKVLGSQQSEQTQKLIHDLLALAKTSGDTEIATRAAEVAASLAGTLRKETRPATPAFFSDATQDIRALRKKGEPAIAQAAFSTQQQLAEYRSALQPHIQTGGTVLNCGSGVSGKTLFGASGDKVSANRFISGLTLVNCTQALDQFTWTNVIFVNSRITYHGGPVVLRGVIFVNCQFEVDRTDDGFQLLEYASLDESDLRIKPQFFGQSLG